MSHSCSFDLIFIINTAVLKAYTHTETYSFPFIIQLLKQVLLGKHMDNPCKLLIDMLCFRSFIVYSSISTFHQGLIKT